MVFSQQMMIGWLVALVISGLSGCHSSGTIQNVDGVRQFQQGQPQAALQSFQQALAANPQNADAYYNMASTYHYLGRQNSNDKMLQQAENLYHQCLDMAPNHVPCYRALAVLLVDTDRPRSAFTLLERWAERSPQLADPKVEIARLHDEFGETDSASRRLAEAIDIEPGNARAWTAMARLREQDGHYAQALNDYQHALRLNNAQPGVAQRVASLQQRLASDPNLLRSGTRTASQDSQWRQR